MSSRPARIRALALAGMTAFMVVLTLTRPDRLLPDYTLEATLLRAPLEVAQAGEPTAAAPEPERVELRARPQRPVRAELQARAFALVEGDVVELPGRPEITPEGSLRVESALPPLSSSARRTLRVGIIVGHADSMPSPAEAWEERQSEGEARPTFRVLTASLAPSLR